ncbi:MAG: inositol monophosphatase, partial [Smithellaceae bacterium]|nr:inositol monophosphatase [Smithellaceae bacterium]
ELKLKPWDTAAGCLLVSEAGGVVSDLRGEKWELTAPGLIGSNGLLHRQILEVIKAARSS